MTERPRPDDAIGTYRDFNGREAWIKDYDPSNPTYHMGSDAQKKWRSKREQIRPDRLSLFPNT